MKNLLIAYALGDEPIVDEKMTVGETVVWFSRTLDDLLSLKVDFRIEGIPPLSFMWRGGVNSKLYVLREAGIITHDEYERLTGIVDRNDYRHGYFRCWEYGTWQPKSIHQSDGTCGC